MLILVLILRIMMVRNVSENATRLQKTNQKQYVVITVVCSFTLNVKVLLMKFINV